MPSVQPADRRRSRRRIIDRAAKIHGENVAPPRDCVITDISTGGVRLQIDGFDVPDDFVLMLSGEGVPRECAYRVVWRLGNEIGARFVSIVRRTDVA